MELELSLSPPNQKKNPIKKSSCHAHNINLHHPRQSSTFPLLSSNQHHNNQHATSFFTSHYHQVQGDEEENNNNNNVVGKNELFVKVKMDGVGIARKINLSDFHSYQMLTSTLLQMFDKGNEMEEEGGSSYRVMYQHRDHGNWLLVGDLPWEMFIQSVKRIQMVRNRK